jgi:hypothetical protein
MSSPMTYRIQPSLLSALCVRVYAIWLLRRQWTGMEVEVDIEGIKLLGFRLEGMKG